MPQILKVHQVNDYARYIGAPELHPLVSVIHYDELEHCRHSLNNYDVYGMFIADEQLDELTYGLINYNMMRHALMCVSPGQIGGKTDIGEEIQTRGWALLFDPELLAGTDLGKLLPQFSFFTYNVSEALLMNDEQHASLVNLLELLRAELVAGHDDAHSRPIVVHYIGLVLELVSRYYEQQLSAVSSATSDLLLRFEQLLKHYYDDGLYRSHGLPTVRYCAQELFLSPNYFGDLIHQMTGDSASSAIRRFVMQRARTLLIVGATVSQVADQLGFEYPQHFTRMFKKHYGYPPSQLRLKK